MKKRRVLSLLSILLVSLLFSPHTFSQETPGAVVRVAPRPLSTDNDSPLVVDIVIENGQAVTGYQVMLQYDSDHIEYVAIDRGNYLPDDAFFGDAQVRDTDPNDSLKAILFAATAFPNQSEGDGVLATLTFETIINESSDLTLLDVTRLSHDVVDNTPALSSPQLKNSSTHVAILARQQNNPPVVEVVQATYSHEGVFLFGLELIRTLEEMIKHGGPGNLLYDLNGDKKITATDHTWMRFAVRLDVNDDGKINTDDKDAVDAALGETGIRPEDVNGDRVVDNDDVDLVNTAILAVENLSRQWSNLPVVEVVQATYSHEGVFLFREDPEPIATLEEIIRREEWGNERYDLDGDGKITATDLAWMTLAVRLDVNDDGKINTDDLNGNGGILLKDANGDGKENIQDLHSVAKAIWAVNIMSRPVVQVIWYYPLQATPWDNPNWEVDSISMPGILENVKTFYFNQLTPKTFDFNFHIIQSNKHDDKALTGFAEETDDLELQVLEDLSPEWRALTNTEPTWRTLNQTAMRLTRDIYLIVVQSEATVVCCKDPEDPGAQGAQGVAYNSLLEIDPKRKHLTRYSIVSTGTWGEDWMGPAPHKDKKDKMEGLIAHELGHNFGLFHTFEKNHIMGYCRADKLNDNYFTKEQKAWLRLHPAFNNPMGGGPQDALFSVVNHDSKNSTLEIEVTTQNGSADKSVSQFVVEDPPQAGRNCLIGKSESVEMWEGTIPKKISYAKWEGTTKDTTNVSIHIIDAHGHITVWSGTLQNLIDQAGTAARAPLHVSLLPERTGLLPNYPNPFNPETWIPYQLANPADVALTIYDINGRIVRDLDLGHQRAGMYKSRARAAFWDGRNAVGEPVASGIYFYTLKAGDFNATRKMLIRK